jgi:hypothetical protein
MQLAHSTSSSDGSLFDPVLVDPPLVPVRAPAAVAEVAVVAMLATDGDFEPPHPDTSSDSPASAPAPSIQRRLEPDIGSKQSTLV